MTHFKVVKCSDNSRNTTRTWPLDQITEAQDTRCHLDLVSGTMKILWRDKTQQLEETDAWNSHLLCMKDKEGKSTQLMPHCPKQTWTQKNPTHWQEKVFHTLAIHGAIQGASHGARSQGHGAIGQCAHMASRLKRLCGQEREIAKVDNWAMIKNTIWDGGGIVTYKTFHIIDIYCIQ